MAFLPPVTPYDTQEDPILKDLTEAERLSLSIIQGVIYVIVMAVAMLLFALFFGSCSTPRAVEEHHHHHYEADTAAVHRLVDRQLRSWHEESEAWLHQAFSEQSASWFSHEGQKETITELITVSTDSVGRTLRTEQRTISRDITRELQQQEQRLTREYEAQLRVVVDSVGDAWMQRYDSLASHVAQLDSTLTKSTPVGDTRPWYRRLWDRLHSIVVIALIAAAVWGGVKIWSILKGQGCG